MPRDDARKWSKKIERIIQTSSGKIEKKEVKKEVDLEYHDKVLEKIRKGRTEEK